jgi:chromosome segregation ATPase
MSEIILRAMEKIQRERDELHRETIEQSRLLGMSGEREADLRGKISRLERELDEMRAQEKSHFDNYVFAQDQYNALAEAAREVIERWDSPLWKFDRPTASVMNKLRNILDPVEKKNYD